MQYTQQRARAGFTLIELMIVVAILSILAAVALPQLGHYIKRAKTAEATSFLAEIKGRQESYREDFHQYCEVSTDATSDTNPLGPPTASPRPWLNDPEWTLLGAVPSDRMTRFTYSVVAGPPGSTPTERGLSDNRGYGNTDFWYIASAFGDLDGDGVTVTFEAYSHASGIYCSAGAAGWE